MKTLKFIIAVAIVTVALFPNRSLRADVALNAQLPVDPAITVKTLPNGLRYYIRENRKPENRARFRLVINAGSLQETDAQRGLAHFLEHMAFNGTENFEKQELVNFLERIGMQFGADLNAYTSFDETVYMLEVPMDDEEVLKTAFKVLRDWMQGISFETEEINKERGVVIEEWRLGRGAQGRLQDKQIPIILHESRYADRLPIGKVEIIENAPRAEFVDFYKKWYRPNLAALIAVGDFDKNHIEELIVDSFGDITNPENAPNRDTVVVPDHDPTLFSIETDPELQYTQIQIAYKRDPEPQGTAGAYRNSIVEGLYTGMLNNRLAEKVQEANPPYLYGAMGNVSLVRGKDVILQSAVVKEGAFAEGLKALLLEAKRVQRDGFTEAELNRIKTSVLRSMEQAHAERDKTESTAYTAEYTRNFLEQEPIPGIARELELYQTFLPGITLAEVNQVAADWITPNNRVILFSAPEKDGLTVPTEENILDIIRSVEQLEIAKYDDGDLDSPLLPNLPDPGSIVSETSHDALDVTEWKLSNGIRVFLKSTDFKNDQVLFGSYSPGGNSLTSDEAYPSASMAISIVAQSGLGAFDLVQLNKKLAGKLVGVSPSISERTEGIGGSSSPQDLETLFQLIHMYFTSPRADEKTFQSIKTRLKVMVTNRLNDPQSVFADAIEKKLYQDHPRHQPLDNDYLDQIQLGQAFEIYRDRFANAGDFTFFFVGNVSQETLKPFLVNYLATLPSFARDEEAQDINDPKIPGKQRVVVRKGLEPKASVRLTFHGAADWSPEERFSLKSAIDILRIRLREVLREDKGGVYGVGIYGGLSRYPEGSFSSSISFGCEPDKVEDLIEAALGEVNALKQDGPSEDNLNKIKEADLRSYERGLKENGFWLSNLSYSVQNELDPNRILTYPERVEALTAERIQAAAKKYFSGENLFEAILLPEADNAEQ